MMKPKRRRRQSPDKECWSSRADVLDDFFTPPDRLQSQSNIEWSSSDEDLYSKSKVSTSSVMRLTPVEDKILDAFPSEAASLHSKLNFIKPSNTKTQSLPNNQVSEHERNLDFISRHSNTPFLSDKKTRASERKNRGLCETKISPQAKSEFMCGSFGEPAKTPIKSVCQKDSREVLDTSPVIGLHRTQCASENILVHNIEIHGSAQCYSDSMKVLGRTFTKRRSSSIQGLSGGSSVKKNFSCNSPILGSSRKKDMGKKDAEYMRVRVKGRNLHTELNRMFPKTSTRNNSEEHSKNVASYRQSITNKAEEMDDYAFDIMCEDKEVQEVTTQPDTSGKMNQPCTYVQEEEINEYGYNILSQSDSEGHEVRSQSNTSGEKLLVIDVCESPLKDSQASSPVLLKGSVDPSITSESTLSPQENVKCADEISKNVGFRWVRTLQQHTPEKQACKPVEFVDSTKKKERKDGEAARLRRFINSWQSDVQVWLHETSVSSLKTRPPKIGETSVNIFSPGSATSHIKKELHYEKPSKSLLHTVKKDKIDIDSSQSSVGCETNIKCKTEEKKIFTVKILKLGILQGNAALCETCGEYSNEFLKSTKEDINSSPQQFKLAESLKYYIYFNFGDNMPPNLHPEDRLAIYAPWHYLEIPALKIPVLFASFFKMIKDDAINCKLSNLEKFSRKKGRLEKKNIPPLQAEKTCILEWSCSCVVDLSMLPSMCDSRKPKAESMQEFQEVLDSKEGAPTLRSVKNASQELYQDDNLQAVTVSEAVQKCGGSSVRQSSILVRVHRVVSHRKKTQNIDKWEVIAQDANGIFCTIDIPNRPFVREVTEVIENGEGKTWYFTHINIVERLTDSENPGLFSMISSFHHSYQRALQNNPLLCPLLEDHITAPSQTFCYVFSVNLGITKVFNKEEEVVIPLTLPNYSLEDIFQITANSQRGSICFLILYKRGDFLYVMSEAKESSDEEPLEDCPLKTEYKEGNSNIKRFSRDDAKNLIIKVEVSSKITLPRWIPSDGTIMMYVAVKDVVIWYGNIIIDEYSVMQPVDKKSDVTLSVLVSILKPLSSRSHFQDLAVVSGTIQRVDEESAATWTTCSKCGSAEVEETSEGNKCSICGLNAALNKQYYLEIWLGCGNDLKHADIKVKLYQTTIQKLLKSYPERESEEYNPESLIGRRIGPMVCIVEKAIRNLAKKPFYFLLQLPY
ncbi:uncharacterized protein LOC135216180 [Macrobrachium nipponense]|uniref:uncharacterized protein LOC135216180 n=1 Tax=Macrobrachium nipponense TaxID=159736 RepID=UPI0030C7CFC9